MRHRFFYLGSYLDSRIIVLLAKISILLLVLTIILFSIPACNSNQDGTNLSPPPPPPERPGHWHPKLDSYLNQLIDAEEQGDTEAFAQSSNIELIDGSVRVIIECMPGQAEEAAEAATGACAEVVNVYRDMVGAVVPINKLTALADEESIQFIRLPALSVETTGD